MSTSPSSAASASMAPPSRTSRTRPSTRAPVLGAAAAAARTRSGSRPVSRMRSLRVHAGGERFHERAAEALVGPGDEGGASSGHAPRVRSTTDMSEANIEHRYHAIYAWLPTSRRPGCGCCARSRSRARSRPPRASLGYTQSAVSRQVAALEAVAGRALFERRRDGVVLTPAGARLLARAVRVLDELDAAIRDAAEPDAGAGPVRLGTFATAAAGLLPGALASLPRDLVVSVREGTTPALTRGAAGRDARSRGPRADAAVPAARRRGARARAHDPRRARAGHRRRRPAPVRRAARGRGRRARRPGLGGQPLGGRRVAARRLARPRRAARRALRRARLVGQAAARRRRPGDHDARPRGARRAPGGRAGRRRARRAAGAAAPGPRPPAGPARRQSGARWPTRWSAPQGLAQASAAVPPGSCRQPRSRRRATWRSSAARRASHAPPTDVIHEIASPRGAGVGR